MDRPCSNIMEYVVLVGRHTGDRAEMGDNVARLKAHRQDHRGRREKLEPVAHGLRAVVVLCAEIGLGEPFKLAVFPAAVVEGVVLLPVAGDQREDVPVAGQGDLGEIHVHGDLRLLLIRIDITGAERGEIVLPCKLAQIDAQTDGFHILGDLARLLHLGGVVGADGEVELNIHLHAGERKFQHAVRVQIAAAAALKLGETARGIIGKLRGNIGIVQRAVRMDREHRRHGVAVERVRYDFIAIHDPVHRAAVGVVLKEPAFAVEADEVEVCGCDYALFVLAAVAHVVDAGRVVHDEIDKAAFKLGDQLLHAAVSAQLHLVQREALAVLVPVKLHERRAVLVIHIRAGPDRDFVADRAGFDDRDAHALRELRVVRALRGEIHLAVKGARIDAPDLHLQIFVLLAREDAGHGICHVLRGERGAVVHLDAVLNAEHPHARAVLVFGVIPVREDARRYVEVLIDLEEPVVHETVHKLIERALRLDGIEAFLIVEREGEHAVRGVAEGERLAGYGRGALIRRGVRRCLRSGGGEIFLCLVLQ